MIVCLEIPDDNCARLFVEAHSLGLSFNELLLSKISTPFRPLAEESKEVPQSKVGVVGLASERKKKEVPVNQDFETATAERIPQSLIDDIMREGRLTIQHVYRLAACPPPTYRFTLPQLIDCLPIKCTDFLTANQERGWPAPFHKFMHEEMHVDYDSTVQPIIYWRTRD